MQVVHVIAGMQRFHGGPTESLHRLRAAMLQHARVELEIHTVGDAPIDALSNELNIHPPSRLFPFFTFSPELQRAVRDAAGSAQILHSHGLWLLPNLLSPRAVKRTACAHVISPHGMLSPRAIARKRLRKLALMSTWQGWALRHADCLHATSLEELADIRRWNIEVPVAVIPLGVDISPVAKPISRELPRRLLFLGRLDPIKGLDRLLSAWQIVAGWRPQWRLSLVGPDSNGYREKLARTIRSLGLERVEILDPCYGEEKERWLSKAELVVLPSSSESFGLVVAEALGQGTPVVTSRRTPWKDLESQGCGWSAEDDPSPLAETLLAATGLSAEVLHSMGLKGRSWMRQHFGWERAAGRMHETYRWLRGERTAPGWIDFLHQNDSARPAPLVSTRILPDN